MKWLTALLILAVFPLSASVFDPVDWKSSGSSDGIDLYMQSLNESTNFYKAVFKVRDVSLKDLADILLDFERYSVIFPKTILFKPLKKIDQSRYEVYTLLDFSPMKNREYLVEACYSYEKKEGDDVFILEWYPSKAQKTLQASRKNLQVSFVNGRWTLRKIRSGEILISVEYCNDFEINVLKCFREKAEKFHTAAAIHNLLKYHRQTKLQVAGNP